MDDKNAFKLCASLLLLIYAVGTFIVTSTGSLYPYLHFSVLTATFLLLGYTLSAGSVLQSAVLIVFSSVATRVIIFQHPESLISVDPDLYAYWAQLLVESGRIEAMGLNFYESAPLFLVSTGIVSIITSLATPDSFITYPLLGGIVFPLAAAAIVKWLPRQTTNRSLVLAMLLASISPTLMTFSYRPKAQVHATFIWLAFFLLFLFYMQKSHKKRTGLVVTILLLIFALAVTHKLPPAMLFLFLIVFSTYGFFANRTIEGNNIRTISPLLLFSGFIAIVQMIYISDFFGMVITRARRLISAFTGEESEAYEASEAVLAVPGTLPNILSLPDTTMTVLVFERSYMLFLLLFAGTVYAILFIENYDETISIVILSIIAVTVSLTIVGVGGVSGLNPSRTLLLGEVFLLAIISWGVFHRYTTQHLWTGIIWILVGVFIVSQIFTPVAVPEYENNPRYYLETDEVDAKLFGCQYISDTVYTDTYYAQEAYIQATYCGGYSSLDRGDPPPLYEGTVLEQEYDYIAHRTSVDVYEGQHTRYQLTWEPETAYNEQYNRIYVNSGVSMFSK